MREDVSRFKCPVCGKGYIYSRKHQTAGTVYVHKVKQILHDEVIIGKKCIKRCYETG